ncbi:MAG: hypothetical protein ABSC55_11840 [Syntrophorhabdales bacterium]|jgi:hypothetical protein
MKKVLVVVCVIVMAAAANAYASPAVDSYIQAIASLAWPMSAIPAALKGCGAVRDERTGDFLVLVPREYCGTNAPGYKVSLGYTKYGSQVIGYCQDF